MPPPCNSLHDHTGLFRLVSGIRDFAARAIAAGAYLGWSAEFLKYVETFADATQKYIKNTRICSQGDIDHLTGAWLVLHDFIKPVVDASALNAPGPLVRFLNMQLRQLSAFEDAKVVVGLVPELNYFQHRTEGLRNVLQSMHLLIGGPRFDMKIGFISLPYSVSRNLFINCILYHELGHFVFSEAHLWRQVFREVEKALRKAFRGKGIDKLTRQELTWVFLQWAEELFADLFAVKLLGPAYTFAAAELTSWMRRGSPASIARFSWSHPPDALRFREQIESMTEDGWGLGGDYANPQAGYIGDLAAIPEKRYEPPSNVGKLKTVFRSLITTLCQNVGAIHEMVGDVLVGAPNPHDDYSRNHESVMACFSHGIVPSVTRPNSLTESFRLVCPTTVLNTAVLFWLREMAPIYKFMSKKTSNPSSISDRARMEERVEAWAGKAIEDYLMLKNRPAKKMKAPRGL